MKRALFLVDIQNDFMPGGSLAIPFGDKIIPVINDLIPKFDLVVLSRDWHPMNHKSFTTENPDKNILDIVQVNGKDMTVWPPHCVQNTDGAKIHDGLKLPSKSEIFTKGSDATEHPFSGFAGKNKGTLAGDYLKNMNVDEVYVVGLAGDYCVKETALDSVKYFKTYFVVDATRFIGEMNPTLEELAEKGVMIITSRDIDIFMSEDKYYTDKKEKSKYMPD